MKLLFHQLRMELSRSAPLVCAYLALLFLSWGVAAAWFGDLEISSIGNPGTNQLIPGITMLGLVLLFPLLIFTTALTDSPAEQDGFLSTRPLPRKALFGAKGLFLFLALILPATLTELFSLLSLGVELDSALLGALERFFILGALALIVALFCAHWSTPLACLLAGGISIGITVGLFALVVGVIDYLRIRQVISFRVPEPTTFTLALGSCVLVAGLAVTATRSTRHRWKSRKLIPSLIGVTSLAALIAISFPIRHLSVPTRDQALVERTLFNPDHPISISRAGIGYSTYSGPEGNDLPAVIYHTLPESPPVPDSWELRWGVPRCTFRTEGRVLKEIRSRHSEVLGSTMLAPHSGVSTALVAALQDAAPEAKSMHGDNNFITGSAQLNLGTYPYRPEDRPTSSLTVDSTLITSAFEWSLAASLPLTPTDSPAESLFRFLGANQDERSGEFTVHLAIKRYSPLLLRRGHRPSPFTDTRANLVVALSLPSRELLWIGDHHGQEGPLNISSAQRRTLSIVFRGQTDQLPSESELSEARILVMTAKELGTITTHHHSAPFTILERETRLTSNPRRVSDSQQISQGAFTKWLRDQPPLPSPLTTQALAAHLDAFFKMAERATHYYPGHQDLFTQHLAQFVPSHLDLLINRPPQGHRISQLLNYAITFGATPAQRDEIVSATQKHPRLIHTIIRRGWISEAQDILISQLQGQNNRNQMDVLRALLTLEDPTADDTILKYYQANPHLSTYRTLRDIPRLHARVEEITREQWSPGMVMLGSHQNWTPLHLALAQGRSEALSEIHLLVDQAQRRTYFPHQLREVITATFLLPPEVWKERYNERVVFNWLLQHEPTEFKYDPVLRRFTTSS